MNPTGLIVFLFIEETYTTNYYEFKSVWYFSLRHENGSKKKSLSYIWEMNQQTCACLLNATFVTEPLGRPFYSVKPPFVTGDRQVLKGLNFRPGYDITTVMFIMQRPWCKTKTRLKQWSGKITL